MLFLKRVVYPWDWVKSSVTGKPIKYPEYYYEDDTDGFIIEFKLYRELKQQEKAKNFDYSKLQQAQSNYEYEQMMEEYTKQYLMSTVMDRQIAITGREEPRYGR